MYAGGCVRASWSCSSVCSSLSRPPTPTLPLTDELTCGALDVIRLRFVPRNALSNTAAHQVSPPACQMFIQFTLVLAYRTPPPKNTAPSAELQISPSAIRTPNIRRRRVYIWLLFARNRHHLFGRQFASCHHFHTHPSGRQVWLLLWQHEYVPRHVYIHVYTKMCMYVHVCTHIHI